MLKDMLCSGLIKKLNSGQKVKWLFPIACPKDCQKYRINKGKLGWKSTETARAVS